MLKMSSVLLLAKQMQWYSLENPVIYPIEQAFYTSPAILHKLPFVTLTATKAFCDPWHQLLILRRVLKEK